MIEIVYLIIGLDEALSEQCELWIQHFARIAALPSLEIPCVVRRADGGLRDRLEETLDEDGLAEVNFSMITVIADHEKWEERNDEILPLPRIVVVCQPSHSLAAKAQVQSPGALWGVSNGSIAIIYHHEAALIWHEMFHLLGAEDCYEGDFAQDDDLPVCGNWNCVMQYAPSLPVVGDPPFVCQSNIDRMRKQWITRSQVGH